MPFDRREAAIERFSIAEGLRSLVIPVFDTAPTSRFAEVTLKNRRSVDGTPTGARFLRVACSTPKWRRCTQNSGSASHRSSGSDLIGVEVARHLYEECVHRKAQGGFRNPNVYFYCRNVLGGTVFPSRSIDTTLTFALTHEIWSYGTGLASVRRFAEAIFERRPVNS